MQGFKSFPDKIKLDFGKGMTAVVGPNGSGKSNIADAVKWVLGEQSTKSLRGAKMEDVIFSGTGTRKAQGFAEVTLKLDNSDRRLDYDADEVAVTRRYFRSGDSEYRINGASVRLRDINELFMDTGIGRDGYSMVSQGRIEEMVSAKSEDRREMFEEAAGISHYRYRRTDAIKRLDAAEDNLVRLRDILTELESRVGPLRTESEKAKKFLELSDRRKELEIGLWLDQLGKSAASIRDAANKYSAAKARYDELCASLDELIAQGESQSTEIGRLEYEAEQKRGEVHDIEERIAAEQSAAAVSRNTIERNAETVSGAQKDIEAQNSVVRELEKSILECENDIERLNAETEELKKQEAASDAEIAALREEDGKAETGLLELSDLLDAAKARLAGEESLLASAEAGAKAVETRSVSVRDEQTARGENLARLQTEREQQAALLAEAEDEIGKLDNSLDGYNLLLENAGKQLSAQREKTEAAELALERKKSRLAMLKETERSMEGYQGSVKAVLKESMNGRLKGIRGPLSQLISTDAEYSVAVETALGAAIQNIVTDTEQDAKRAIYYLKDNNLGRATFMPVSSVRGRTLEDDDLEYEAGYIGIASELVKCDEEYYDIVDSLLGRTVVTDDLDSAIAIGKKYSYKFKLVTLDGQVINAGGSMTGGSGIRNSGFLVRANEQKQLESEIEKDGKALEEAKAVLKTATEERNKLRAQLDGTQGDLLRARERRLTLSGELKLTDGRIEIETAALKALEDESLSSSDRIAGFKAAAAEAKVRIAAAEREVEELKSSAGEAAEKRRALAEEISAKADGRAEIRLKAAERARDIENIRLRQRSFRANVVTQNERLRAIQDRIDGITAENGSLRAQLERSAAAVDDLNGKLVAAREAVAEINAKRDSLSSGSAEIRAKERALTEERERLSGELIRLEDRKTNLENAGHETEQRLYDEYRLTRREAEALGIELGGVGAARKALSEIKNEIKALGNVNVGAIEEYKEVSSRYEFMNEQVSDVEKSRTELRRIIADLTENMSTRFREQFARINAAFSETFSQLFGGGKAELKLENEMDILECAIDIKAQPPGKNIKSLSLLSGGEKGLTAIALLFAMLKVTPSAFCLFDEVEAALDDINVNRCARYIRGMAQNTQFILITHRRGTMEEADIMYGVTMQEKGVSTLVKLETARMADKLGLE